jgi:hypothetical protein
MAGDEETQEKNKTAYRRCLIRLSIDSTQRSKGARIMARLIGDNQNSRAVRMLDARHASHAVKDNAVAAWSGVALQDAQCYLLESSPQLVGASRAKGREDAAGSARRARELNTTRCLPFLQPRVSQLLCANNDPLRYRI